MPQFLTTDPAILLLTLGVLLVYLEFNRPGRILFGAAGLLCVLLAVAAFVENRPGILPILLILGAIWLLCVDLRIRVSPVLLAVGTLGLAYGFYLLPGGGHDHVVTAIACGLLLGSGTSVLTGIARRARASKRLD